MPHDEEVNKVVTSQDYEVGEGSEKVQESISLQQKERNDDNAYDFPSSEDITDTNLVIPKQWKIQRPLIRYKKSVKTGKLLPCKSKG